MAGRKHTQSTPKKISVFISPEQDARLDELVQQFAIETGINCSRNDVIVHLIAKGNLNLNPQIL